MDLHTTNLLLGIMAAVSVVEALVLIGMAVAGILEYRRVTTLISDLEARQIAPMRQQVNAILADVKTVTADVKTVTARISQQTERVDHAIAGTMERVDVTAERVKSSVMGKVNQAVGLVRGVRAIIMSMLHSPSRHEPPAAAEGRV